MNNEGIYLQLLNFEKLAMHRVAYGRDFYIDLDFNMKELDKIDLLLKDTIYSAKRFGPQKHEPEEVQKYRYSCKCGAKIGSDNIGEYCDECSSTVEKVDFPLSIMAWIRLPTRMLTPVGVYMVRRALSGKNTKAKNSKYTKLKNGQTPFLPLDMWNFYDNFELIISNNVKNPSTREFLLANKKSLFTNVFPVTTRRLRRFMRTKSGDVDNIQADTLSTKYTDIISSLNGWKDGIVSVEGHKRLMKELYEAAEEVYEKLAYELSHSKEKTLKGEIYSTKSSHSGRLIIEPDNVTKLGRGDICRFSYDGYRTLHKEAIMEYLQSEYGFSYFDADKMTNPDFVLDKKGKDTLRDILMKHKGEFWILINRPPTIDMSGIIAVEIVDLCDENVLYINPIILGLIRGDFDGDTLSTFVILMALRWRLKETTNPRRHALWWDRSINGAYSAVNDQVVVPHMIMGDGGVEFIDEDEEFNGKGE